MSNRRIAVTVGILFFVQMVTFLIGSSLVQKFLDGETGRTTLTIGVLFELAAGAAIVAIGFLMYRVLKPVNQTVAAWYPAMRVAELTVTVVLGVYLLSQLKEFPNHLLWVYIPTGIGGLILGYLLFVSRVVPRPIAVLGVVGYAMLLLGVSLDLAGAIDLNGGAGLVMLSPGGIFEFVVLPLWLIAKGFRAPAVKAI
ncbi:MAG: DUF4386 domain-containing protein [Acidimicrobiia bacterium]